MIKNSFKKSIIEKVFSLLCFSKKIRDELVHYLVKRFPATVASTVAAIPQTEINCLFNYIMEADRKVVRRTILNIPHVQLDYLLDTLAIRHINLRFSQEGEDVLMQRMLPDNSAGFFVDVGACHPLRFSNTYALYRQGWRGINIDATPGSMIPFHELRPEDINVECAISDTNQPLSFHCFVEPALNTFDNALAETYVQAGCERREVRAIYPRPLKDILDEHLPKGQIITLMTIDVEGEELPVLRSNDWNKYSPEWIILEVLDTPLGEIAKYPTIEYLAGRGYMPIAKLCQSVILKKA